MADVAHLDSKGRTVVLMLADRTILCRTLGVRRYFMAMVAALALAGADGDTKPR